MKTSSRGTVIFPTTNWSLVRKAQRGSATSRRVAVRELCNTYRKPLFDYLRCAGYPPDKADDIVQGFFLALLEGASLSQFVRGSFRSYILGALKHYASDVRKRENALKRGGSATLLSIEQAPTSREIPHFETPDAIFEQSWAITILRQARDRLRSHYERRGKGELYQLTEYCVTDPGRASCNELSERLNVSPAVAKITVHRMRRRYAGFIRQVVGETVSRPQEVETELRHLLAALTAR